MFTPPSLPHNEPRRAEAVASSGLLASDRDPYLTALAKRTRLALNAQWSGVALIVEDRQHVIASSGGMLGIYRRSTSLSGYVVMEPDRVFHVLDTLRDERFAQNPFVEDGLIRFYAGAPITDDAGYALGALCVTDRQPRQHFTDAEAQTLKTMADAIGNTVSGRRGAARD